jgi:hypothetical protein
VTPQVGPPTPEDEAAVARTVDALRRLSGGPSKDEAMAVLGETSWVRYDDERFPQGRYFELGGLTSAVAADDDGQARVTFGLAKLDHDDNEYTAALPLLEKTTYAILQRLRTLTGYALEEPGEEYDEPAMSYLEPSYWRLGPWVLSIGLVHLESDEPAELLAVMQYWEELEETG